MLSYFTTFRAVVIFLKICGRMISYCVLIPLGEVYAGYTFTPSAVYLHISSRLVKDDAKSWLEKAKIQIRKKKIYFIKRGDKNIKRKKYR